MAASPILMKFYATCGQKFVELLVGVSEDWGSLYGGPVFGGPHAKATTGGELPYGDCRDLRLALYTP